MYYYANAKRNETKRDDSGLSKREGKQLDTQLFHVQPDQPLHTT